MLSQYSEPGPNNGGWLLQLAVFLFFAVIILGRFVYYRLHINHPSRRSKDDTFDSSLIMTMYSIGVVLNKVSSGTLAGFPYSMLVTNLVSMDQETESNDIFNDDGLKMPPILPEGTVRAPTGKLIMNVKLPAQSQVHIAGFSLQDDTVRQTLGNIGLDNMLAEVKLEGNFPDYFKLYCTKGREIELRQILDPTRMEFLVDFCQKMNWELFEDNVYFVQTPNFGGSNSETVVQAAEDFAQKILPTLLNMNPTASAVSPV